MLLLLFLLPLVICSWDSLYSPSSNYTFIKLETNEIIPIDSRSNQDIYLSNDETVDAVIQAPTKGNYSLALANGELYAIYSNATDSSRLAISKLDMNSNSWDIISYTSTLSSGIEYYLGSSIMTILNTDDNYENFFIYGGSYNNSITSRLLEFNTGTETLGESVISISPTGFYGAGNSILDPASNGNIVIGGKASTGWVSMFQIAVWEYQSWTFKTVTADFSVNSRTNALVLPVYSDNSINDFLVIGGELNDDLSSPYVLNLNVANEWKWSNLTGVGDFDIYDSIGSVVINNTLISIEVDNSGKRSGNYIYKLYDINNSFNTIDILNIEASQADDVSEVTKTVTSVMSSSSDSSTLELSEQSKHQIEAAKKKQTTITVAVVVPIVTIIIILIISYFLIKKYKTGSIFIDTSSTINSDSSSTKDEIYKEINEIDNQSISSWNQKLNELNLSNLKYNDNENKSTETFTFENNSKPLTKLKNVYKINSSIRKSHEAFANPEDYKDKMEINNFSDETINDDKYHNILNNKEEDKIDEFLNSRDVQVLVSSKRRSKLRITNPDLSDEDIKSISESSDEVSTIKTDFPIVDLNEFENKEFFNDVLKAFDE